MVGLEDVLVEVDELGSSESGVLAVDGGPTPGVVLIEDRSVCWAATVGGADRLRRLLRDHARHALDEAALEGVLVACRRSGGALSAFLVDQGILSDDALRAALRQHTVESLLAMSYAAELPMTWIPHRGTGYRARHVFSAVELLAAAGVEQRAIEVLDADLAPLGALATRVAGAFVGASGTREDRACLVWGTVVPGARLRELVEVGDWAMAALGACGGFSRLVVRQAVSSARGPTAIGWRPVPWLVHAAVVSDPSVLCGIVADLDQRGVPMVLSPRGKAEDLPDLQR